MDNTTPVAKEKDTVQLQNLNRWLIALVAFMLVWTVGIFFFMNSKKLETQLPAIPVISVDPTTGKITNVLHSNLFPKGFTSSPAATNTTPLFVQKSTYVKMEYVIINYFFVAGIVVDVQGDAYTVMYRDANRCLQKVVVPKELLLVPTSASGVNPASLLGP